MANNKIKFPLWLTPECKQIVEDNYREDQCQSRSEFIEKAIWFYAGFLHTLDAGAYLPRALKQMLDGTLDIAVLRGEYPWDGTQFLLSQEDICLIYAREYEGKPLSDYLYIDHQTDASLGAQMARWRYENGVTGDTGSFVVDNITACLEMVKRGLGWALMPEIALDNFDGCVRPCTFENGEPFLRRTYIFCQRDAAALPQVQLFMDMLKKKR